MLLSDIITWHENEIKKINLQKIQATRGTVYDKVPRFDDERDLHQHMINHMRRLSITECVKKIELGPTTGKTPCQP